MNYSKYTTAIRAGDREAFREFMDSTLDGVYHMVCRIVAREDAARDIVQEAYIQLWEKRNTLKRNRSVLNFTRKIAINKAYDLLRKRRRMGRQNGMGDVSELARLASSSGADDIIMQGEYETILSLLIASLSPRQQLIFTLAEVESLGAEEIAGITGFSRSSIKSNLYHARKAVREKAERII